MRTVFDPSLDRLLARHPNAPPDLLEDLSHSSDTATRRQVVRNAATPREALLRLARQFPKAFMRNPVVDWLLLEDPDLLQDLKGVLKSVLRSASCPASIMSWAVRKGSTAQQLALAMNPAATPEMLAELAAVKGRVGAAARAHTRHPQTSRSAKGTSGEFIKGVKAALISLDPERARLLWRRGQIGPEQWLLLSARSRAAVIGLPASLRGGREPDSVGCRAFANLVSGPTSLLEHLSKHSDEAVRLAIAGNPAAPAYLLEALVTERERWGGSSLKEAVARNPGAPQSLLEVLAKDERSSVRASIASNPRVPPALVEEMIRFQDEGWDGRRVRLAVATNMATPDHLLRILSKDTDSEVQAAIAGSATTPAAVLEALVAADAIDPWVRLKLAGNSATPTSVLADLAKDEVEQVRRAVAVNVATPDSVLELLAQDDSATVREAVVRNRATPQPLLERLRVDRSPLVTAALTDVAWQELVKIGRARPPTSIFDLGLRPARSVSIMETWRGPTPAAERIAAKAIGAAGGGWKAGARRGSKSLIEAADPTTPSARLEELGRRRSTALRWLVAGNTNAPEDFRAELTMSIWLKLGVEALPPLARKLERELRPRILLVMDARHWWHKIKLLATRHGYARLPERMSDEEMVQRFENELECFSDRPHLSLAAEVMGAGHTKMLYLRADCVERVLKSKQLSKTGEASENLIETPRLAALQHPNAPVENLIRAFRSVEWLERMAVARNLNAPSNLIEALKKDANRFVSKQAADTDALQKELQRWSTLAKQVSDRWQLSVLGLTQGVTGWDGFEGETIDLLEKLRLHYEALAPLVQAAARPTASLERVVQEILFRARADKIKLVEWMWADPFWEHHITLADIWDWGVLVFDFLGTGAIEELRSAFGPDAWIRFWKAGAAHREVSVRAWVAGSSVCPGEVLADMAQDQDSEVLVRLAGNSATPYSHRELIYSTLTGRDIKTRRLLVSHLSTPPHVLEALSGSGDADLSLAVATHPNCPIRCADAAIRKVPETSLYKRLLFQGSSREPADAVQRRLLRAVSLSSAAYQRRAVAEDERIDAETLGRLLRDRDDGVRAAAAGNPGVDVETLRSLLRDPSNGVRAAVASNRNSTADMLRELGCGLDGNEPSLDVRRALSRNPATPADMLDELAEVFLCAGDVAQNPAATGAALAMLVSDLRFEVRLHVAGNPSAPEHLLELLAEDPEPRVRQTIAARADAAPSLIEQLARDINPMVCLQVSQREGCLPPAVLALLSKNKSPQVRLAVSNRAECSRDLVESLLRSLTQDRDPELRIAVVDHRFASNELLAELESDDSRDVRLAVNLRRRRSEWLPPASSRPAIARLAATISRVLSRSLSGGGTAAPITPSIVDLLNGLQGLLLIPKRPSRRFLMEAARSRDWLIRLGVAMHPGATTAQLRELQRDAVPEVLTVLRSWRNLNEIQTAA